MVDFERAIIRHSVDDVIHILENERVSNDLIQQITVAQLMNRISIAHLSIERAMKFLINAAGGTHRKSHDLSEQLEELRLCDPRAVASLSRGFADAVKHYRYNSNSVGMSHFRSIEAYLATAGSDRAFQDIRYWELTQSGEKSVIRQADLAIHLELLHGLAHILVTPDQPFRTVANRVEEAANRAMFPNAGLAYAPNSAREKEVKSYLKWLQQFPTYREALATAVASSFETGNAFANDIAQSGFKVVMESSDPAIRYFAQTLDVLPRQPRVVVPCVEWLGPEDHHSGLVSTPGGDFLGHIERGRDGLWYVTPARAGMVKVSARAETQTDARCYLAAILTRVATFESNGRSRELRIIGDETELFRFAVRSSDPATNEAAINADSETYKLTLWDCEHGIKAGDALKVIVQGSPQRKLIEVLEGVVSESAGAEITVAGSVILDIAREIRN